MKGMATELLDDLVDEYLVDDVLFDTDAQHEPASDGYDGSEDTGSERCFSPIEDATPLPLEVSSTAAHTLTRSPRSTPSSSSSSTSPRSLSLLPPSPNTGSTPSRSSLRSRSFRPVSTQWQTNTPPRKQTNTHTTHVRYSEAYTSDAQEPDNKWLLSPWFATRAQLRERWEEEQRELQSSFEEDFSEGESADELWREDLSDTEAEDDIITPVDTPMRSTFSVSDELAAADKDRMAHINSLPPRPVSPKTTWNWSDSSDDEDIEIVWPAEWSTPPATSKRSDAAPVKEPASAKPKGSTGKTATTSFTSGFDWSESSDDDEVVWPAEWFTPATPKSTELAPAARTSTATENGDAAPLKAPVVSKPKSVIAVDVLGAPTTIKRAFDWSEADDDEEIVWPEEWSTPPLTHKALTATESDIETSDDESLPDVESEPESVAETTIRIETCIVEKPPSKNWTSFDDDDDDIVWPASWYTTPTSRALRPVSVRG